MTGRCEWCRKSLTTSEEVREYRSVSEAPDRGGRTKLYVTRFHAACDAERIRNFEESRERAAIDAENDRKAVLAALKGIGA